jgi:hypothetical protein
VKIELSSRNLKLKPEKQKREILIMPTETWKLKSESEKQNVKLNVPSELEKFAAENKKWIIKNNTSKIANRKQKSESWLPTEALKICGLIIYLQNRNEQNIFFIINCTKF